jgi:F0F1-type ATP synthase assembly protein I
MNGRANAHVVPDQRAGAVALFLLRFTLIGVAAALVAVLGNVALKVAGV